MRPILNLTLAVAALDADMPLHAATARLDSYNVGGLPPAATNPGFATVVFAGGGARGEAGGYDFLGGAGAYAFAGSLPANMQAWRQAAPMIRIE